MGNLIGNSRIYNIHAENEIAEILSHYSPGFVQGFIKEKLDNKLDYTVIQPINDVDAIEQNFKQIIDYYPEEQNRTWETRTRTYYEIISKILENYNLGVFPTYESNSGFYMEASLLYDFLVSRYKTNAVEFFSLVIMENSNEIYKYLKMDDKRETITYMKKLFSNDSKLGVLVNNIDLVMSVVSGMDFTLEDILRTVYTKDNADILSYFLTDNGNFYKTHYIGLINSYTGAPIVTDIRMSIQAKYMEKYGLNQQSPILINNTEDK